MGLNQAQPERTRLCRSPVGPPAAGIGIEVRCVVSLSGEAPGVDEIHPEASGHCSAVLTDTPLQCHVEWCAQIIGVSHCSASLGKCIPGCWRGGSDCLSNGGFQKSNVDSFMAVEQWTSSLLLQGCWRCHWSFFWSHPVYMCCVDLEKAYERVSWGIL